ncbi:Bifunctional dihydrofolate reductase-thymidylate synthase isoform D [Glycine soja]|uniref:Bifunctional dihydrofolate reductase-thymidylate synthase n=1 Tax=Glycine soja TaxID=3848 RepID=A0A445K368_GLYSO|nr:Bifunctional dihydrofolate reductase-thymidylate synthase isoform D [Glycine soja]
MPSDSSVISNGHSNGSVNPLPNLQRTYQVVVAATQDWGIGKDGKLPWRLPTDLKFFKEITMKTSDPGKKNAIVMGRKTWESIPLEYRPLSGRLNVVLTRSGSFDIATAENVVICGSMSSALELLAASPYSLSIEKVFVIGGGQIFREALNVPGCEAIHLTEIQSSIECDTFMPPVDFTIFRPWYSSFPKVENNIRYSFTTYVRVRSSAAESAGQNIDPLLDNNSESMKFEVKDFSFLPKMISERHEEYLYLKLVQDIIAEGTTKGDRTGTGTLSKFGCQMRFNLRGNFPLLTTKAWEYLFVNFDREFDLISSIDCRKYFGEGLLKSFFGLSVAQQMPRCYRKKAFIFGMAMHPENTLMGKHDYIFQLFKYNLYIFLYIAVCNWLYIFYCSVGLTEREEGDLGPVYGFQWRHFGARYTDMHHDYSGQGFDQLLDVINKIKCNPDDRRIILSAWNPVDLKLMALPPCHMFAQFYVAHGELSCQMYQRSADMGLGIPFNIASYALLTCMIAHVCDLIPGDFIHVIGDAHIYRNHVRPLQEQLHNQPKPFPTLKINPKKKDIDSFVAADFKLIGYDPHQKIDMKLSV